MKRSTPLIVRKIVLRNAMTSLIAYSIAAVSVKAFRISSAVCVVAS
jgi:hypothetical protein